MSPETYTVAILRLHALILGLGQLPLAEMAKALERTDVLGPFVSESLYSEKETKLKQDLALVETAQRFIGDIVKLRDQWQKQ